MISVAHLLVIYLSVFVYTMMYHLRSVGFRDTLIQLKLLLHFVKYL
jgi:hypothetical protein